MKIITGNIFTTQLQTIVNTVNCVGIMGAGIALECKLRYPEMFLRYKQLCADGKLKIGLLWLYKHSAQRWILNFPTKDHWRNPTKEEYLHKGLSKFVNNYKEKGISSIAFPLLGASHGGLSQEKSLRIMQQYLDTCDLPIEVYIYDPHQRDDLYDIFKSAFLSKNDVDLAKEIGLRIHIIITIRSALENPRINSISSLATTKGIGLVSLEKSFEYLRKCMSIS